MTHAILGGGGPEVDLISGNPRDLEPSRPEEEAKARYHGAMQTAAELTAELQANPVIQVLAAKYRDRLIVLAKEDPQCQALEGILLGLRYKLDLAPTQAQQRLYRVLGPRLLQFLKEEEQAAPDGIPAEQ
ncbi:MAG: hypothetical protein HY915_14945 [Desulfovibrio sp.]|nr:hypothetical protein [Desulfovibrio sp.]